MLTAIFLFAAAIALPPKPDHYVTDRAGVLKSAAALNEKLANFERATSDQLLVYVDRHVPADTTMEEMSAEAIRQWGVGQKGKDNGAILFVFTDDHKMRLEVGYGLEGSLTDAKAKWITSTVIKPVFRRGDFDRGITNGVDAILAAVRGEQYRGSGRTVAQAQLTGTERFLSAMPIAPVVILIFVVLFFVPFGLLFWSVATGRFKVNAGTGTTTSDNDWSSSSDDSSSFSSTSSSDSSSSSSSSSFEGGGGSGGGGGASDSW